MLVTWTLFVNKVTLNQDYGKGFQLNTGHLEENIIDISSGKHKLLFSFRIK